MNHDYGLPVDLSPGKARYFSEVETSGFHIEIDIMPSRQKLGII